jgi:hypothetical protein
MVGPGGVMIKKSQVFDLSDNGTRQRWSAWVWQLRIRDHIHDLRAGYGSVMVSVSEADNDPRSRT